MHDSDLNPSPWHRKYNCSHTSALLRGVPQAGRQECSGPPPAETASLEVVQRVLPPPPPPPPPQAGAGINMRA